MTRHPISYAQPTLGYAQPSMERSIYQNSQCLSKFINSDSPLSDLDTRSQHLYAARLESNQAVGYSLLRLFADIPSFGSVSMQHGRLTV